jgi:hypothetical protein
MPSQKRAALTVTGIIAALLLFAAFVLPPIVCSQAVKAIEAETGRKAKIEKISINPLTLTITVNGLSMESREGGPFISVARVRCSLGLASVYRRALILSEVSIDSPSISFARLSANNYNFNDIIELQKAKPKPEKKSKGEFLFSINNISLTNGSLDFDDRAVVGGRKHTIRSMEITLPFISNIAYLVEKYTDPHLSAIVNGAPFSFNGKSKPLSKSMETSVHIDLKQLSLPEYIAYFPVRPPADLISGRLTVSTDVTYTVSKENKPELGVRGEISLAGIALNMRGGQPLIRLPNLLVKASDLELFARRFFFDEISVDGLELFISRSPKGEWMYSQLLTPPPKKGDNRETAPATGPEVDRKAGQLLLQVAAFTLRNGTVHFSDAQPTGGFKSEISQIEASVTNFTTSADKTAEYELSMMLDNEATFSADGSFSLTPLSATISSELSGLKIQRGWPYLSNFLTSPIKGTIDFSSEASYNKDKGVTVEKGHLLASGISASYGDKERLDLSSFEITNAGFSQSGNSVDVGEIRLAKADMSLSREADGTVSILSLLRKPRSSPASAFTDSPKQTTQQAAPAPVSDSRGIQPAKEFSFRLRKLLIDSFNTTLTDKTLHDKPRFTLTDTSLSLSELKWPRFKPAAFLFSSTFNKATPLRASGEITPLPFRYKGSFSVGRLPLRDFEAYFPSNVNLFILGGYADTDVMLDISLNGGKPSGSFKGNAGVRSFHAIDTIAEEDLLKWESLQFDEIQGNLDPFSLTLHQIALNGVYSRIIVRKDGTLNLQNLVEKQEEGTGVKGQETGSNGLGKSVKENNSQLSEPKSAAAPPMRNISIEMLTIQDGTIFFTDNHLSKLFATTFYNLGGRVSGLSSEYSKFADVELRGNLENHSPLQITGQINPLRGDLFVDLKASFHDIELSPVTPYSGTFLGYTVEKGKLFLDLKYHIDKKQLNSENKVFIDQFTLGEKVESDKATSLPVKLGLALLKDRNGEIHLDLPVTGRTDDPKFSIWGVVWQVVKNLLVKAVTSPFSLLSSMFGGGQDFSAVMFTAGSTLLSPPEEAKLSALAKALIERPALKVELKGFVDREKDTEGYRNELMARKLKNEKFLDLGKEGTKTENIQVLPEEYAKYLTSAYKKEKFPKPRNFLGFVKDLPPEEMKKLIITNTLVGDPELSTLAHERVVAVKNFLITMGNVPAERVFEKNENIFKTPEKETASRSRVELNAIVQ